MNSTNYIKMNGSWIPLIGNHSIIYMNGHNNTAVTFLCFVKWYDYGLGIALYYFTII